MAKFVSGILPDMELFDQWRRGQSMEGTLEVEATSFPRLTFDQYNGNQRPSLLLRPFTRNKVENPVFSPGSKPPQGLTLLEAEWPEAKAQSRIIQELGPLVDALLEVESEGRGHFIIAGGYPASLVNAYYAFRSTDNVPIDIYLYGFMLDPCAMVRRIQLLVKILQRGWGTVIRTEVSSKALCIIASLAGIQRCVRVHLRDHFSKDEILRGLDSQGSQFGIEVTKMNGRSCPNIFTFKEVSVLDDAV